jgi:long-chain acyl-CoA synthetase
MIDNEWLSGLTDHTLPQILVKQAKRLGTERIAIREKAYGIWQAYHWQDYLRYVQNTSLGLIALGLKRGDHVGIIVNNHPEWLFSELGIQAAGAVSLNLFTSAIPDEISSFLQRIRASVVIVQDQEQVDKLIEIRSKIGHVIKVVYIDPTGMRSYHDDPWLISMREVLAEGEKENQYQPGKFLKIIASGNSKDTAIMIQTSGTTGISKLAMLTHRSILAMARTWLIGLQIRHDDRWISFSPPAWIVDQMWCLGVALAGGTTVNFPETSETVVDDFREIGPTMIITASRFWEDLASQIRVKMSDAGPVKQKFFDLAEKIGQQIVDCQRCRVSIPRHLKGLHKITAWVVYKPLLDRIGCSNIRSAYTGGHPISPDVIRFFHAIGLNLKQCYGLTEAGGIFQVQPDREIKAETVGKPLPGVSVRLSSDQEVLVRSDSNFSGYYNDFNATEDAFLDGWLRTGDAGYFDADGHLVIIGRKEEIIRNKLGEAFSPDFVETRLKFSPYIKEAVTFGEGRPFITAMINIDPGNVGNWAEERMIPYTTYTDLSQRAEIENLILKEVRQVNGHLPDFMKIRRFVLLYKLLDADDEELTRTGKVRRRFVYGMYIRMIEAMYEGKTKVAVKGKVRYRDGRIGEIQTTVRICEVN